MPDLSPATSQANMQQNSELTVLVVDPNPGIRANLQNLLNQSGISRIESAVNASTAIKQLGRKAYDIILCEYDLGNGSANNEGQDGQQLLEDLRHHRIIAPWAIFIMLTSEGAYDKVVGAAELTPTDYILKPFTADMLNARIRRALARRAALLPAYQLVAQGDVRGAIRACTAATQQAQNAAYSFDFARLRADLHLTLKEYEGAESVYRQVLAAQPVGWARLGLARALAGQGRHDDAIAQLEDLLAVNPRLMAGYDELARCREARGDAAGAQKTLEDAVAISPNMVRRLRKLGELALDTGDADAAEKSLRQVVTRSRYSEFRNPEDHVNLVKALVSKGDAVAASGVIRDLERTLRGTPAADACRAISIALLHDSAGNAGAAAKELRSAVDAVKAGGQLSANMRIGLARACLAHQLDEEASDMMLGSLSGAPDADDGLSAQQALNVFIAAGRPDLADGMGRQLRAQAQILLGVADEKRNMGDVRGAVQTLLEARHMAPGNLQVMIALAGGILRQIMEMGWDEPLAAVCTEQLESIRAQDAAHPRLQVLDAEFTAAKRKYGIAL